MTADQMPDVIDAVKLIRENMMYSYNNCGDRKLVREETKQGVERIDALLKSLQASADHPTPAQAQGESADAEIAAIIKAYKSVAKQLGRYPAPTLPDAIQSVEWAMNNTGVIFFNYPDDGYKQAVELIIKAALSHAPEVVTVEEYLHGYLETVNKIGIDKNCAAYKFLMETNSRHTKYMQEKYPHGLIIKRTE